MLSQSNCWSDVVASSCLGARGNWKHMHGPLINLFIAEHCKDIFYHCAVHGQVMSLSELVVEMCALLHQVAETFEAGPVSAINRLTMIMKWPCNWIHMLNVQESTGSMRSQGLLQNTWHLDAALTRVTDRATNTWHLDAALTRVTDRATNTWHLDAALTRVTDRATAMKSSVVGCNRPIKYNDACFCWWTYGCQWSGGW